MSFTFSQKVESIAVIIFIILYFAAAEASIATMFIFGIIVSGCLLMVGESFSYLDLMFMDDKAFYYEPYYETWKAKTDSNY